MSVDELLSEAEAREALQVAGLAHATIRLDHVSDSLSGTWRLVVDDYFRRFCPDRRTLWRALKDAYTLRSRQSLRSGAGVIAGKPVTHICGICGRTHLSRRRCDHCGADVKHVHSLSGLRRGPMTDLEFLRLVHAAAQRTAPPGNDHGVCLTCGVVSLYSRPEHAGGCDGERRPAVNLFQELTDAWEAKAQAEISRVLGDGHRWVPCCAGVGLFQIRVQDANGSGQVAYLSSGSSHWIDVVVETFEHFRRRPDYVRPVPATPIEVTTGTATDGVTMPRNDARNRPSLGFYGAEPVAVPHHTMPELQAVPTLDGLSENRIAAPPGVGQVPALSPELCAARNQATERMRAVFGINAFLHCVEAGDGNYTAYVSRGDGRELLFVTSGSEIDALACVEGAIRASIFGPNSDVAREDQERLDREAVAAARHFLGERATVACFKNNSGWRVEVRSPVGRGHGPSYFRMADLKSPADAARVVIRYLDRCGAKIASPQVVAPAPTTATDVDANGSPNEAPPSSELATMQQRAIERMHAAYGPDVVMALSPAGPGRCLANVMDKTGRGLLHVAVNTGGELAALACVLTALHPLVSPHPTDDPTNVGEEKLGREATMAVQYRLGENATVRFGRDADRGRYRTWVIGGDGVAYFRMVDFLTSAAAMRAVSRYFHLCGDMIAPSPPVQSSPTQEPAMASTLRDGLASVNTPPSPPVQSPSAKEPAMPPTMLRDPPRPLHPVLQKLEVDATAAAWRMAGSQFVKLARDPVVALLSRNLGPDDESLRGRIAAFLDTELGASILAGVLSAGLSAIPLPKDDVSQRLAGELRVRSMAGIGDGLADVLMGPLRQVAVTYLQGQPPAPAPEPPAALPDGSSVSAVTEGLLPVVNNAAPAASNRP